MSGKDKEDPKAAVKELLLEEYRNFSEALWKNEQTGETRVNWFLGIVSGASAGLIGLATAERRPRGESLKLILVAALFALIAFGIVTLLRIKKRNDTTDGYKKDTDRVRRLFKDHFDTEAKILGNYHPFRQSGEGYSPRRFGGLIDIVVTVNALLFAALGASLVYRFDDASPPRAATCAAAAIAFLFSFIGQSTWVRRRQSGLTHAGGIVYQMIAGEPLYCLVGPQKPVSSKTEWLFPKGHIKDAEEPWEAALREVREETGVVARLICPVGVSEYELSNEKVVVKYYLMEASPGRAPREDSREMRWLELDSAQRHLTHADNQTLLSEAEAKRRAHRIQYINA